MNFDQIKQTKGIYKESREFFIIEIHDIVNREDGFFFELKVLGERYAKYENQFQFYPIPTSRERKFFFGKIDLENFHNQFLRKDEIVFVSVVYIGELLLRDELTLEKFQQEDISFWDDYF
ncbi:MAG: hypothetical protein SFU98_07035 [Leptospiraceae bacterium]|nr:hypothetical protein [Leptospiraceae bacterium]